MGHGQRELIFDRSGRTFEAAGAAMPALVGIGDDRFVVIFRPGQNIARADVIAVPTLGAFVGDDRGHGNLTFQVSIIKYQSSIINDQSTLTRNISNPLVLKH